MTDTKLFRVTHKTYTGFWRSFKSSPLSWLKAEELANRIEADSNCYDVKIVEAK